MSIPNWASHMPASVPLWSTTSTKKHIRGLTSAYTRKSSRMEPFQVISIQSKIWAARNSCCKSFQRPNQYFTYCPQLYCNRKGLKNILGAIFQSFICGKKVGCNLDYNTPSFSLFNFSLIVSPGFISPLIIFSASGSSM